MKKMNLQAFHHPNNDNSWLTFVCLNSYSLSLSSYCEANSRHHLIPSLNISGHISDIQGLSLTNITTIPSSHTHS